MVPYHQGVRVKFFSCHCHIISLCSSTGSCHIIIGDQNLFCTKHKFTHWTLQKCMCHIGESPPPSRLCIGVFTDSISADVELKSVTHESTEEHHGHFKRQLQKQMRAMSVECGKGWSMAGACLHFPKQHLALPFNQPHRVVPPPRECNLSPPFLGRRLAFPCDYGFS